MKTYISSSAHCATCANWTGPCQIKHNGSYVEVSENKITGRCLAGQNSSSQGNPSSYYCTKFTKWAAIK